MAVARKAKSELPPLLHQISGSASPQTVSEMIDVAVTVLRPKPRKPVESSLMTTPCGSAWCPPKYGDMPGPWAVDAGVVGLPALAAHLPLRVLVHDLEEAVGARHREDGCPVAREGLD